MTKSRIDALRSYCRSGRIPGPFCLVAFLFCVIALGLLRPCPSYATDPCSNPIDFQEVELGQSKRMKCVMTAKLLSGIPDGTPLVISMPDQFTTATPEVTFSSNNPPTLDIEARLDPATTAIRPYSATMVILAKATPDPCGWLSFEIPVRAIVKAPSVENLVQQWNLSVKAHAAAQQSNLLKMEMFRDMAASALKAPPPSKKVLAPPQTETSPLRMRMFEMEREASAAEAAAISRSANRTSAHVESQSVGSPVQTPGLPQAEQTTEASSAAPSATMPVQAQATATPGVTQKATDIHWNSVISPTNRDSTVVADLVAGCPYKIHFDIAALDYSRRNEVFSETTSSVPVNQELKSYVSSGLSSPIGLNTVPFNFGAVRITKTPAQSMSIDTVKLLDPHRLFPETENLADFAKAANAGRFTIDVMAGADNTALVPRSGCGTVGLSLWSGEEPPQPMGFVVRYVRIADGTGRFPGNCADQSVEEAAAPANLINKLPLQGDATLYVFRLNDPPNSVAVFQSPGRSPETWLLPEHPEVSLSSRIEQVKSIDAAPSLTEGQLNAEPELEHYHQIYEGIETDLFKAQYAKQEDAAKSALKTIREIAKNKAAKNQRARFVVLISGENGREIFYPVGLLSDGGSSPKPLAMSADFVEELPSQTIRPSCIPTSKTDLAAVVKECKLENITVPPSTVFSSLRSDLSSSHTPELLLLLAHQGNGNLSYEDPSDVLHPGELGLYEPNSAGILLTCNPDVNALNLGSNWPLEFNKKGMGALVFSPFLVPEDFAACFASVLSKKMDEAIASKTPTTLSALYRAAIEELSKAGWKKRSEIAYQFILAGDVELPICKQNGLPDSH